MVLTVRQIPARYRGAGVRDTTLREQELRTEWTRNPEPAESFESQPPAPAARG